MPDLSVDGADEWARSASALLAAGCEASGLRNLVNLDELESWLRALWTEKLGVLDAEMSSRALACERWLMSVGRNWIARKGAICAMEPLASARLCAPQWMREAGARGAPLHKLSLAPAERERLAAALDWMRSDEGPRLSSDWSKISMEQALRAEREWIDAKARAALRKRSALAEAAGTELFAQSDRLGPDGRMGWRWVEVKSAEALEREGALMRHCVGSYAKEVESGRVCIFSLRDADNKPALTLEARQGELVQLKALSNGAAAPWTRAQLAALASAFSKRCDENGWEPKASDEILRAGVILVPGCGFIVDEEPAPSDWTIRLMGLMGSQSAGAAKANELVGTFVALGWEELALVAAGLASPGALDRALEASALRGDFKMSEMIMSFIDLQKSESLALYHAIKGGHMSLALKLVDALSPKVGRSLALREAADRGDLAMVELLAPLSDPLADSSGALRYAARHGHVEVVEALLPISDPKASASEALRQAAENGHLRIVEMLAPVSDPWARSSEALRLAAKKGRAEMVRLLIPVSDPLANASEALRWAAREGHWEVARLLAPVSDPLANESEVLRLAAGKGLLEMVDALIPVSDPLADDSEALARAAGAGRAPVVERLIPVSDPRAGKSKALLRAAENGHWAVVDLLTPVSSLTPKQACWVERARGAANG